MNELERDVGLAVKHTKITHSVPTTLPSGVVSLPHVSASDGFVRGNGTPNAIAAGVANVDKSKNKCELYNTELYGESLSTEQLVEMGSVNDFESEDSKIYEKVSNKIPISTFRDTYSSFGSDVENSASNKMTGDGGGPHDDLKFGGPVIVDSKESILGTSIPRVGTYSLTGTKQQGATLLSSDISTANCTSLVRHRSSPNTIPPSSKRACASPPPSSISPSRVLQTRKCKSIIKPMNSNSVHTKSKEKNITFNTPKYYKDIDCLSTNDEPLETMNTTYRIKLSI